PPRQPHLRLRVRPGQVLVLRGKDRPLPAVRRGADPVVAPQGAGTGPGGGGGPAAPSGGGAQPGAGAAAVPRGGLAGGRYPLSPPPGGVRIRARRGVQPVLRRLPRPVRARRRPPRSEERRVGKECRSRWSTYAYTEKIERQII